MVLNIEVFSSKSEISWRWDSLLDFLCLAAWGASFEKKGTVSSRSGLAEVAVIFRGSVDGGESEALHTVKTEVWITLVSICTPYEVCYAWMYYIIISNPTMWYMEIKTDTQQYREKKRYNYTPQCGVCRKKIDLHDFCKYILYYN